MRAMKAIRVAAATVAVLGAGSGVARADIILLGGSPIASFTDITAQGFGNNPRLLTLQTSGVESGYVTPDDVIHGDAIPNSGGNKSNTETVAVLGWGSGADVGIGFNASQTGNSGITVQDITLTLYNGLVAVGSFSLGAAVHFTQEELALQQGNGSAVFAFVLDAAQQLQYNALLVQYGTGLIAGLGATLGCPPGSPADCRPSNDGPDSFVAFDRGSVPVPDGGTTVGLLGLGMLGLGYLRRRLA